MSIPIIAFFNNNSNVGQTSLVYHLAWMYADLGLRIVVADLDPQANLTTRFLDEERLEELWLDDTHPQTVYGSISPLLKGANDIAQPHLEYIGDLQLSVSSSSLALLVGDLSLSLCEDLLSDMWPRCLDKDEQAIRITSAFWHMMQEAARFHGADVVLMDLSPNLGSINRAALIAANYVVIPLSPDLLSLQGLRNLGPTFRKWRSDWQQRQRVGRTLQAASTNDLELPNGEMQPIGYIVQQYPVRLDHPMEAHMYTRWFERVPLEYRKSILGELKAVETAVAKDSNRLALFKNYPSLTPLAQEAHKPIFHLKPADGALGSHMQAVHSAYKDFEGLARTIAGRINLTIPTR